MFNQFGQSWRPHPTPVSRSRATPPSQPAQSAHSAQYRPDFLKGQPAPSPQPAQSSAPVSSYERARAALADPLHYGSALTERQQIATAWQHRTDPKGVREAQVLRERTYGKPSSAIQPRNTLTRYSNPSRRPGL